MVQCLIIIIVVFVVVGVRHVVRMGERRILVGKPEGKTPLGRPRCIWEDNIKNKSSRGVMGRHELDFFWLRLRTGVAHS